MQTNDFLWLLNWYLEKFNFNENRGIWIQINSLDNPGWFFLTSLTETGLENHKFEKIRIDRTENDWIRCFLNNDFFEAAGGPNNFFELLRHFRNWVENVYQVPLSIIKGNDDNLNWILEWFNGQCDGYWEHVSAFSLITTDAPGWSLRLSIGETELEQIHFDPVSIQRTEMDWINCSIKHNIFEGRCSFQNLNEMLGFFRDWAESAQ